ncbi:uncharacterized protein LOC119272971 [Triticum dicoccoides]|uniref:uncharacterized protein LOC119272971 n=1 Tax=Triticum dicoccoides TaxID=85692 RepID=UPI0018900EB3|nr:uncharacterized protein LOC119272971 [Triticum dicoccoides]
MEGGSDVGFCSYCTPPPIATPVLLTSAKRVKQDPSFPQALPVIPAMVAKGWSTLPPDLVRLVADSLLATNDIDCYMCFCAVCPGWRAATDDPRSDASDHRFRSRCWIVLDEVFQSQGKEMLLGNTHTGRFLHRELPLLSDHYVVTTTRNGYLILADKSPPHSASILNPLTGVVIRFMVSVPQEAGSFAVLSLPSSALGLTLFSDSSNKIYLAHPDSKSFAVREVQQAPYGFFRKAVVGGVYADIVGHTVIADLCLSLMSLDAAELAKLFAGGLRDATDLLCFLVCLAGHMLLVLYEKGSIFVLKKDVKIGKFVALDNIGRYAIFIGPQRCLAVGADKFPGIEANCAYFTEQLGSSVHICKCNIKDRKVERISEAADFVKQDKKFALTADHPSTIIHLLSGYTLNIPDSQLALQQVP